MRMDVSHNRRADPGPDRLLARAFREERRFLEVVFPYSGARVEAALWVLEQVAMGGGELYTSALLGALDSARRRLASRVVERLIEVGMLRRVRDEADRRRTILKFSTRAWRRQVRLADALRLCIAARQSGVLPERPRPGPVCPGDERPRDEREEVFL